MAVPEAPRPVRRGLDAPLTGGSPVKITSERSMQQTLWTPVQTVAGTAHGHVRGIPFTARYGESWTADLLAC